MDKRYTPIKDIKKTNSKRFSRFYLFQNIFVEITKLFFIFQSSIVDGFQAWLPGQPDNFQNNEECLMMNPKGRCNDVNCKSKAYVICRNALITRIVLSLTKNTKFCTCQLPITLITLTILGWCWVCGCG